MAKPSVANDVVSISVVCTIYLYPFHISLRSGLLTCPFPLTTTWYLTSVVRLRTQYESSLRALHTLSRSWLVTFVWLLLLAATGIYNITRFPGIFRAFDPSRAIMCNHRSLWHITLCLIGSFSDFVRTKDYETLSGVLLAITGCEALFAK